MKDKFIVYFKPSCSTSRKVLKRLDELGIEYEPVNYLKENFTRKKLEEIVGNIDVDMSELLRKRESVYKELELDKKKLTKEEVVEILQKYPNLIQRPILESKKKFYLVRPPEKIVSIMQKLSKTSS